MALKLKLKLSFFIWAYSSRLTAFVYYVVVDVKLGAQEKLFVLLTFSSCTGLCRIRILWYMQFLDKKRARSGPEISVHPGVTLSFFFSFFVIFLLTEIRETTLHKQTGFPYHLVD